MDTERLSADEVAYHRRIVTDLKQARERLTHANAAYQSWAAFLVDRYGLQGGDAVAEDGTIRRGQQKEQDE